MVAFNGVKSILDIYNMCFHTLITKEAKKIKEAYNVERVLGESKIEGELIYNHANGFSHPLMWVIPQKLDLQQKIGLLINRL